MPRGVKVRACPGSIQRTESFIATRTARRRQTSASRTSDCRRGCSLIFDGGNGSTRRSRSRIYLVEFQGAKVASVKTALRTACKLAGVEPISAYVTRHTAASWLVARGLPTRMVADFIGTGEQMILSHYGHLHPNYQNEAARAIGRRA